MAQYGPELATSGRDAINRVHEFDSRRSQQDASEYIYSSYDGIVDQVLPAEGSAVGGGATICTLRLTGGRKDLKGVLYISKNAAHKKVARRVNALFLIG